MSSFPIVTGPDDGELSAGVENSDLYITISQLGGQSAEVTDRDYTVTVTTNGGVVLSDTIPQESSCSTFDKNVLYSCVLVQR